MDNVTHSLVGALIGQTGLKRKTALAMPTLIIAANIPDIDAVAVLLGGHQHLAIRRGITHGPIAMLLLPLLLWAAMLWFDRWQERRGKRPEKRLPVHKGWLLALAYLGTLSHPFFDWLNVYGIRLLMPLRDTWFAGDAIFIIDVWMLSLLIVVLVVSMRRERRGMAAWRRPAILGLGVIFAYVFANGALTAMAEHRVATALRSAGVEPVAVVASPPPLYFWQRDVFWRSNEQFGATHVEPFSVARLTRGQPIGMDDPRIAPMVAGDADARAWMVWTRMPYARFEKDGTLVLRDQRFDSRLASGRFTVRIAPKP
jgi:inner membrane protein